jgi:hypothetical protein
VYDTESTGQEAVTLKTRYERLKPERDSFLRRARECSTLTLPYVMPPEGTTAATDLPTPFQSAGAEGVLSLASKLLLALLPPGTSFFKLDVTPREKEVLLAQGEQSGEDVYGEIQKNLGKYEQSVLSRLEAVGARVALNDAVIHLLVCGNVLGQVLDDDRIRLHYLNNYVVKRDPAGNVLDIVVHERIAKTALPEHVRQMVEEKGDPDEKDHTAVDVYTRIWREDDEYQIAQEVCGQIIPESRAQKPLNKLDWFPLRFTKIDGQDYGRGRVEQFLGDLQSLEGLEQAIVEGSAQAAKVLWLCNEAGTTDFRELARARNGSFVEGSKKDIEALTLDKFADFQVAAAEIKKLEDRINRGFLVAQQRQAERVTAEEVRAVIAELERALGGTYAILAQEMQLPLARIYMARLQRRGELPALPEKFIEPKIVTGLEALGRGADFEKYRLFIADLAQEFGQAAVAERVNIGNYAQRKATALQLDIEGILYSEETVQQRRQEQAQREMAAKLGPEMIRSATNQYMTESQQAAQSAPDAGASA